MFSFFSSQKRICVILKAGRDSFVFIGKTRRIFRKPGLMIMYEMIFF